MIKNESIFYYTFLERVDMEREALPPQRALMSTRSEPQPVEMLEAQVIEPMEKREALPTDDAEKQDGNVLLLSSCYSCELFLCVIDLNPYAAGG